MAEKFYFEICVLYFIYSDSEPSLNTIISTTAFISLPGPIPLFSAFLCLASNNGCIQAYLISEATAVCGGGVVWKWSHACITQICLKLLGPSDTPASAAKKDESIIPYLLSSDCPGMGQLAPSLKMFFLSILHEWIMLLLEGISY